MSVRRDLLLIDTAAFLRSTGVGLLGVVLGVYLYRNGYSATRIGLVIATGLAGAALATVVVSFHADRLGRRRTLFALSLLGSLGSVALALRFSFPGLLALAFVAMLNGMGTDRSAAFALEQAIIPGLVPDRKRTWALSAYNLGLDSGHALGALGAGLPFALAHLRGTGLETAYSWVFLGLAATNLMSAGLYLLTSRSIEAVRLPDHRKASRLSGQSKHIVFRLAALFSVDAFGGGLLSDALVSYWFFRRFGIPEQHLGVLFFVISLLNALSHLGAAWLARRIGLVNTMVFTHLPSSVFLMAVPLAPTAFLAIVLLLLREALVEMDVPTRQSYIAAVVRPEERTFASGVTNLTRNGFWAVSTSIAGLLMQHVAFSLPLFAGGGVKIVYDVLLYRAFRKLKPPEEMTEASSEASRGEVRPA